MTKPAIRLPLSGGQQQLIAELNAQAAQIRHDLEIVVKAIVASDHDLSAVDGWCIAIDAGALVLTPPTVAA